MKTLTQYVKTEHAKLRKKSAEKHLEIRRRHPILQGIAGTHTTPVDESVVTQMLTEQSDIKRLLGEHYPSITPTDIANNRTPDGRRLAKWLLQKGIATDVVDKFFHHVRQSQTNFEISVRYKDIMRMADSKHYRTCFTSWRGIQKLRYLADPAVGLILRRDSKGDFSSRRLVRLLTPDGGKTVVLGVNRLYGNDLPLKSIAIALKGKIEVYSLGYQFETAGGSCGDVILNTIDTSRNPIISRPVWEDSSHSKTKGGMAFSARKVSVDEKPALAVTRDRVAQLAPMPRPYGFGIGDEFWN